MPPPAPAGAAAGPLRLRADRLPGSRRRASCRSWSRPAAERLDRVQRRVGRLAAERIGQAAPGRAPPPGEPTRRAEPPPARRTTAPRREHRARRSTVEVPGPADRRRMADARTAHPGATTSWPPPRWSPAWTASTPRSSRRSQAYEERPPAPAHGPRQDQPAAQGADRWRSRPAPAVEADLPTLGRPGAPTASPPRRASGAPSSGGWSGRRARRSRPAAGSGSWRPGRRHVIVGCVDDVARRRPPRRSPGAGGRPQRWPASPSCSSTRRPARSGWGRPSIDAAVRWARRWGCIGHRRRWPCPATATTKNLYERSG